MTALAFAALQPERVSRLALLDIDPMIFKEGLELLIPFDGPEVLPSLESFVESYRERWPTIEPERLAARLLPRLRALPDGTWTWKQDPRLRPREWKRPRTPRSRESVDRMVNGICSPVLLLRGETSPVVSRGAALALVGRFAHSGVELVEIAGAGHALMLDAPAAVALALRTFLSASSN